MALKIIDVWLNATNGNRTKPDGVATTLASYSFPAIFRGDTLDLRFRLFTYGVELFAVSATSTINLSVKETRNSDTILISVPNTDFTNTYWTTNPNTVLTLSTDNVFTEGALVIGSTSTATGRVLYHDVLQRRVHLRSVTGTFQAEALTETLVDGSSGTTGTCTAFLVEGFDRTKGRVSCKFDLTATELETFMSNQTHKNVWAELSETFSTSEVNTIGQFELQIKQDMG